MSPEVTIVCMCISLTLDTFGDTNQMKHQLIGDKSLKRWFMGQWLLLGLKEMDVRGVCVCVCVCVCVL